MEIAVKWNFCRLAQVVCEELRNLARTRKLLKVVAASEGNNRCRLKRLNAEVFANYG